MVKRTFSPLALVVSAMAAAVLLTAPPIFALTPISGMSPYPDGGDPNDPLAVTACNGGQQQGIVFRNSETEPYIAANPTNPENMIACWHQDRWSTGSAQGVWGAYTHDGGATWSPVNIPFTNCSGADENTGLQFERASDPWISYGADGAAYYMALVTKSNGENAMAVAKTTDGGASWSNPQVIKGTRGKSPRGVTPFHDKNSLTADPHDPNLVYASWMVFRNGSQHQLVGRSTDGGASWTTRSMNHAEVVDQHVGSATRQGAQIVVLPDGTLLNAFFRILFDPRKRGSFVGIEQALTRSTNQGKTWERLDTPVAGVLPSNGFDIELGIPVRDAGIIPDIAVNPQNGYVYIVWQDGRFSSFGASNVLISRSTDGGATWSAPISVTDTTNPIAQNFLPSVSVTVNGTVGVLYYTFANDVFGDATLDTDVYLAQMDGDLNPLGEQRLTDASFDMRQMLRTGDRGYFPGDYVGLDVAGRDFVAAFTVANNLGLPVEPQDNSTVGVDSNNRQDIVFVRVPEGEGKKDPPGDAPEAANGYTRPRLETLSATGTATGHRIAFSLPEAGPVNVTVFDVAGRPVAELHRGTLNAGSHVVEWDGAGRPAGIYFVRLDTSHSRVTQKITRLP